VRTELSIDQVNVTALSGLLALLFLSMTAQVLASSDSALKTASDGLLQEQSERPADPVEQEQENESNDENGHHGTHSEHRHHAGGSVAGTTNLDHDHTDITIGGEYMYRPLPRWGIGGFVEVLFADHRSWLLGVPVQFHATQNFWLWAGPGIEFIPESGEEHAEHSANSDLGEQPTTTEVKFLFRIGAGYNFEVEGLVVTPVLNLDLVRNNKALVWGLTVSKAF
jgi:hypothetical protein